MRGYRYIAAVLMAAGAVGLMNGCGSAKKASDGASSVSTAENRMEESRSAAEESIRTEETKASEAISKENDSGHAVSGEAASKEKNNIK